MISVGIQLILIDFPSSPTINSSLNCGRNDKPKPSPKVVIVPKVNDKNKHLALSYYSIITPPISIGIILKIPLHVFKRIK